jgi:predicted membrane protein
VSISSWAFLTDGKVFGKKEQSFVVPFQAASDDYETAERKVRVESYFFVNDLTIVRA